MVHMKTVLRPTGWETLA